MIPAKRIDRKLFLGLGLSTTSLWVLGCGDDAADAPIGGGAGAGGGAAGTAGAAASGAAGTAPGGAAAGGTAAGSAGSGNAGTGGTAGGSAGSVGSGGSGGSAGGSAVAPNCGTQLAVLITANHGHTFQVTAADVTAAMPKEYSTKGASDHDHWLKLTAADFAKLAAGGTVRKLSCNGGHEHEFIVNCVGNAMPDTTSGIPGFCDAGHTCGDTNTNPCPELP